MPFSEMCPVFPKGGVPIVSLSSMDFSKCLTIASSTSAPPIDKGSLCPSCPSIIIAPYLTPIRATDMSSSAISKTRKSSLPFITFRCSAKMAKALFELNILCGVLPKTFWIISVSPDTYSSPTLIG